MVRVRYAVTHDPNLRMYEEWATDVMKFKCCGINTLPELLCSYVSEQPAQVETEYMWSNLDVAVLCVERPSG
jgi:hypothetical protein